MTVTRDTDSFKECLKQNMLSIDFCPSLIGIIVLLHKKGIASYEALSQYSSAKLAYSSGRWRTVQHTVPN